MSSSQANHETNNNEAQLQFARHNFDNLQSLIRFADTKAAAYLTLLIFLGASGIPLAKDVVSKLRWTVCGGAFTSGFYVLSCFGFLVGLLWTVGLVYSVMKPRSARYYPAPKRGHELQFYGHIVTYADNQEYFDAVAAVGPETLLRNLTDQIFELASICSEKMSCIARARVALLIAFCSWSVNLAMGLLLLRWH
jgi:hypothetical protein